MAIVEAVTEVNRFGIVPFGGMIVVLNLINVQTWNICLQALWIFTGPGLEWLKGEEAPIPVG